MEKISSNKAFRPVQHRLYINTKAQMNSSLSHIITYTHKLHNF